MRNKIEMWQRIKKIARLTMNTSQLLDIYRECNMHYIETMYTFQDAYEMPEMIFYLNTLVYFANEIAKDSLDAQRLARLYIQRIDDDHTEMVRSMDVGEPIPKMCPCIITYINNRIHQLTDQLHSEETEDQDVAILRDIYHSYQRQWLQNYANEH